MTVSTSPSKHTVHSPFLLPAGSGGENMGDTGGLSGELGAVTAERENRTDLNNVVLRGALRGGNPEKTASMVEPWRTILGDTDFGFSSGPCPFSYPPTPTIKHHFHPVGCHVWMFLLSPAVSTAEEEEGAGGKLGTLLHPGKVRHSRRSQPSRRPLPPPPPCAFPYPGMTRMLRTTG